MAVLVNGRFLSRPVTGVERYAQEILACLESPVRVVKPARKVRGFSGHLWEQLLLPRLLQPGDTLWSPANTGPLSVRNQVLTLHDMSALEHPEWYSSTFGWWYRLYVPRLVRRVRKVVTSSQWVRQKLLAQYSLSPGQVSVAPGGVDLARFHPHQPAPRGLPERYVLFVGSLQPRKNLPALIDAWSMVHHRFPDTWLVIAGGRSRNFRRVSLSPRAARLRFIGYVPEGDLPGLYAGAAAFVLPSLDEGFGLPVLEAMASGTPVLAAHAGALPEVTGDAGLLFDPHHPPALAEALSLVLSDTDFSQDLVEKGLARAKLFPWQLPAARIQEILLL